MSERLFIYGTLHPDRAPREIACVARRLISVGCGMIRGRLLDLGAYPGLILEANGEAVRGELFVVPDNGVLAALDAYEDYRPDDPAGSLFLRTNAVAMLDDGREIFCWVYVYNG